jgi:hypothetical protein
MRTKALTCPQFENGDGINVQRQMHSAMPHQLHTGKKNA